MGPKKKGDAASAPTSKPGFTEVEKAMYDLEIADLNRKLARLRTAVTDYELRNEELQSAYDKLDEDRADVISYLKKTLNSKTEENTELKDRVKSLEELREEETAEFKCKVAELEKSFSTMKAQLTSENKLLAGKINTLEEFRAIKEDLMKKFEKQEKAFEDQEMKYKRVIYDAEKKFVIGKDKLKREMEARLLHLAQDFQDASESRIAASTHRVIRENIALNNQLDNLLFTQAKVAEQNEKFKESERAAQSSLEVAELERDKAINKSIVQLKVIDKLTMAFQTMQKDKALYERKVFDSENLQAKVQKLTKENDNMILQIRILEQNLHASLGEQNKHVVETARLARERDKYKKVIKDTTYAIQSALKLDQWALIDPTREVLDRKVVLKNILAIINRHRLAVRAESVDSLISFSDVYEKGDLGFVPKPSPGFAKKSKASSIATTETLEELDDKRSSAEATSSESSVETLKTVPSIKILPPADELSIVSKESVPSFTVTSLHSSLSSETETEDSFEAMTEVEKQLALSKLEIQKSILKDLALSQTRVVSKTRLGDEDNELGPKLSVVESNLDSTTSLGDGAEKTEGDQAEKPEDGAEPGKEGVETTEAVEDEEEKKKKGE